MLQRTPRPSDDRLGGCIDHARRADRPAAVFPRHYTHTIEVLLICTGNQCRSPIAEVLLRCHLASAGHAVTVSSAGLLSDGVPASAHAVDVLSDAHIDLCFHRSRRLDRPMVARADLVIGMAREHVREVAVLDPAALRRSFTLKELVRLGERSPRQPDEPLERWLDRLDATRDRALLLGVAPDAEHDVADPIGGPRSAYETTAAEVDRLLGRLVAVTWPANVPTA